MGKIDGDGDGDGDGDEDGDGKDGEIGIGKEGRRIGEAASLLGRH